MNRVSNFIKLESQNEILKTSAPRGYKLILTGVQMGSGERFEKHQGCSPPAIDWVF